MTKEAFTLKEYKTGELHLFKGVFNPDGGCTWAHESICKKVKNDKSFNSTFQCKDESEARKRAAEIGRSICGTCISDLYQTEKN